MTLRSKLLILALLVEGFVAVLAVIAARLWGITLFPLSEHLVHDLLMGTCGALPPLILFVLSLSKQAATIPLLRSIRRTVLSDIKGIFATSGLVDLCFIALLAGFAEELLFRGVVQAKGGIVMASILFGLLHWVTPAYAVAAAIIGFYIGTLYHFSQSLLIPIQLHVIYDFGALVYLKYFVKEQIT